jgi:hypothetical protein
MMLTEWELSAEQLKLDSAMGIPDDAPNELRIAIRNMGPLTRKRFLKKLDREKLTEAQYNEYVKQFTKT